MNESSFSQLVTALTSYLCERNLRCTVAESCTGGSLAAVLTEPAGASLWFDRGFVTYTNQSKHDMLDVPWEILNTAGAISGACVCAMAKGALKHSDAALSAAISGVAGPSGGSKEHPVGTVWIAWAGGHEPPYAICYSFKGNRQTIREQAVVAAIEGLIVRAKSV